MQFWKNMVVTKRKTSEEGRKYILLTVLFLFSLIEVRFMNICTLAVHQNLRARPHNAVTTVLQDARA